MAAILEFSIVTIACLFTGVCPDGWRIFRGYCYQVNTNNRYTWTDAKHYCETQGSFLTDIQRYVAILKQQTFAI